MRFGNGEVIGRSHWELFPNLPEYWEQNAQAYLAGVLEYSEFVAGLSIASVSGKIAGGSFGESVKWIFQPWKNSEGAIGGLILFASEIACDIPQTNRYNKFQSEVKSKQLETIRATNSNSPRKCCGYDLFTTSDGQICYANKAACHLFGYSESELLNLRVSDIDSQLPASDSFRSLGSTKAAKQPHF